MRLNSLLLVTRKSLAALSGVIPRRLSALQYSSLVHRLYCSSAVILSRSASNETGACEMQSIGTRPVRIYLSTEQP